MWVSSGREDDEDLRYLIHFMGDIHQPLHLTGYLRGGNDGQSLASLFVV